LVSCDAVGTVTVYSLGVPACIKRRTEDWIADIVAVVGLWMWMWMLFWFWFATSGFLGGYELMR
jgi:hypothetical protein